LAEGKILDGQDKNKNRRIHYFLFTNPECLLASTFLRFAGSGFKSLKTSRKTFGKAAGPPPRFPLLLKLLYNESTEAGDYNQPPTSKDTRLAFGL
jgi:hypothetical protein